MVVGGSVLIDIGTDHAYLPVNLIQRGIIPRAIASDIGEQPLKNAEKTVAKCGLADKIELRLTPGLEGYNAQDGSEIVIAGMGGTLIAEILEKAEFIKNPSIHLVLQPQSHSEDVRRFLCKNGFTIEYETVCEDTGRIYNAISAYYTGDMSKSDCEGYFLLGELPNINDERAKYLIDRTLKVVKNRIKGLEGCGRNPEELEMLKRAMEEIGYK